ncbi:sigma-54-dependent transcriptional regulator [Desulfitobacterium sp. Sab5]|uniref:sigma-54-dependent transcriptional regulator n=1 Tax=Desulfitobacterium nosdiversum TaxID=3375356 RepID=UPI003CFB96BE
MFKVLIVDDELDMAQNISRLLRPLGVETLIATEGEKGLEMLKSESPALVLTDLMMPGISGMDLLSEAKAWNPDLLVIMITGFGTIAHAVEAIKNGAYDFIAKPFSGDQLRVIVERALEQRRLKEENAHLKHELQTKNVGEIVGQSPELKKTFELVRRVAPMDTHVLIQGESGTGKELIARSLHFNSQRCFQPFIPVDCAALSEELLESELFGHERGAFTGAAGTKLGLIEVADGGTLFLDEIGELSPRLQVKLLRVLQEKTFRRVGGTKQIEVDIRIVSATNRDLLEEIRQKHFREDLYFRLNGITVQLPPLRKRQGDIQILAQHFLEQFNQRNHLNIKLGREVLNALEDYPWPGNVRELKNVIERSAILADKGIISLKDLPTELLSKEGFSLIEQDLLPSEFSLEQGFCEAKEQWIERFEQQYLTELLNQYHWNISQAAEKAKINRKTIHRLINKYQLHAK